MATPNDRETPENRRTRQELQGNDGRVTGGPREAAGDTFAEPDENRVQPSSRGIGSDSVGMGSDAAGGSVIDKRGPDSRTGEGESSPERLGERLRDAARETE
jgi:hypothetical protein